jgi:hypothetical protein
VLLVNKFRNKYKINPECEPDLNKLIKEEVASLVNDVNIENKLTNLDKKLGVIILDSRKNGSTSMSNKAKM